jgi:hypothetical protein
MRANAACARRRISAIATLPIDTVTRMTAP